MVEEGWKKEHGRCTKNMGIIVILIIECVTNIHNSI